MLRRAQAYRRWRDGSTRVPARDLTAYRAGPYVRQDTAAQFQAILRGYFERARKGDLVLIPPSAWQADAILAEFSTGRRTHKIIELPYFQDNVVDIPARSFREITTIPKRLLPRHILDKVVKPNAFIQFDNYDTLKLQELAYKSFIRSGEYNTEFRVTSDNHNLNENMHFVIFVKSIAACMKALSEHRREPYSIQEIVAEDFGDFVPNLHANVNSPGWLRLTCNKNGPHIASIIYELFVELGRKALDLAKTGLAIVHGRRSKSRDKRILEIERDTIDVLKMLALSEDVDEIHKMIINLHKTAGLRSPTKIRKK